MSLADWLRDKLRRRGAAPPPPRASALREGWFEELLTSTGFLARYPQYAGVLARMDPIATTTVQVMAVGLRRWDDPASRVQLLVNRAWLEAWPQYRAGVLLHEIQHVVLGHLTNPRLHQVAYPTLMELAMELSADEPIREPLPPTAITLERFARHGVGPGQSSLERYALLAAAHERGDLRLEDWWQARMRDDHRPRQRNGEAGGLGDLLDARSDRASGRNWNRRGWGRGAPTSEPELRRMKVAIARHLRGDSGGDDDPLRDSAHRRVAKELERVVNDGAAARPVDWRRALREAFPRRRQIRADYLRPNRRFPSRVGEVPGRTRRQPRPTLLVGIDTSGSMTGETLDRVAVEIGRLAAHARLTLVECDAAVHRIYPMRWPLGPFTGGGDTDFAPVFDEARMARGIDGLVYFTDGKGPTPPLASSLPTLWAITHGDPFLADFGAIVRVLP